MIGIYQITCNPSKKSYIGSSKHIEKRIDGHFSSLERGDHHSYKLQAEFDKYGRHAFSWRVLIECTIDQLFEMEQKYVETKRPALNVAPVRSETSYNEFSAGLQKEISKKISETLTGKPLSEEHKKKVSAGVKAMFASDRGNEVKRRIANSVSKHPVSQETRNKRSKSLKGKKRSEETKKRMSLGRIGKCFLTDESKRKIREKVLGRKQSPEARAKMSLAHKRRRLAAWASILPQWMIDLIIEI